MTPASTDARAALQTLADDLVLATSRLTGFTFLGGVAAGVSVWLWSVGGYLYCVTWLVALPITLLALGLGYGAMCPEGRSRNFLQLAVIGVTLGGPLATIVVPGWGALVLGLLALGATLARRIRVTAAGALGLAAAIVALVAVSRSAERLAFGASPLTRAETTYAGFIFTLGLSPKLATRGTRRLFGVTSIVAAAGIGAGWALQWPDDAEPATFGLAAAVMIAAAGMANVLEGFGAQTESWS